MPAVGKLTEILEAAGAGAGQFYLFEGRGRILAALPADPAAFVKTLTLYRPQRILPKAWVLLVRLLHAARLAEVVLKKWSWAGVSHPSIPCPGVLLGNPDQPVLRATLLLRQDGSWHVGKFIPDPNRQDRLRREQDLLKIASELGGHAPPCLGWKPCGRGGALWTEWVNPRPGNPSWIDRLEILQSWLWEKESRALREFPAWKITKEESNAGWESASEIRLRPTLRHGDFAPWNLLQTQTGTWVAVDWEEGSPEDAPGLDLVHDLLQQEFLVRRSLFVEAKARMRKALGQPVFTKYLAACGWSGNESVLLAWALAFEAQRRPEIKRWIQFR